MVVTVGKVVDGRIEVAGAQLPEGATVGVVIGDEESTFRLQAVDETELLDRISLAEGGDVSDAMTHLQTLRERFQ